MPFHIIRNDITKVHADAIVNTANPEPVYAGGTDAAVYRAAGEKRLLAERKKIGVIRPGEIAVTPAFRLHAKYIIHTVGPVWVDGAHREFDLLASCYRKSLLISRQLGCRSIAFPLISTGVYGFPKDKALEIALEEFSAFLREDGGEDKDILSAGSRRRDDDSPPAPGRGSNEAKESFSPGGETAWNADTSGEQDEMDITLVVFDRKAYDLSSALVKDVRQFIDENYVEERHAQEYGWRDPCSEEMREIELRRRRNMPFGNLLPGRADDAFVGEAESTYSEDAGSPEPGSFMDGGNFFDQPAPMQEEDIPESPQGTSRPAFSRVEASQPPAARRSAGREKTDRKKAGRAEAAKRPKPQRTLQEVMAQVGESFQERLLRLIDERQLKDSQVYKRANIDRKLFSKIRCNPSYTPGRRTAIALAIALELNMDEMTDLLRRAGIALSPGSKFDLIIRYCVENRIYDTMKINAILFDYDQPLLGG